MLLFLNPPPKVGMHDSITYLDQTLIWLWHVIRRDSKNKHQKDTCVKIEWTICSEYDNHSRLGNRQNWGGVYDHLPTLPTPQTILSNESYWIGNFVIWLVTTNHNCNDLGIQMSVNMQKL